MGRNEFTSPASNAGFGSSGQSASYPTWSSVHACLT
ncbi:Uncharacterised protein [Mycobacteroides abscessus]|nr:Uncharacterised protein [Mycobacteroides abscessus]